MIQAGECLYCAKSGHFSKEHISHVHLVVTRLLENKLFVKSEKCEFHVDTVSFLWFGYSEQEDQGGI